MTCEINRVLRGRKIVIGTEKAVQRQIAFAFAESGLKYIREASIKGGRIDFLVDRVGVEVKVDGSATDVYRQLCDYAEEPRIDRLVLVASKAFRMPEQINGKPVSVISLGSAWL